MISSGKNPYFMKYLQVLVYDIVHFHWLHEKWNDSMIATCSHFSFYEINLVASRLSRSLLQIFLYMLPEWELSEYTGILLSYKSSSFKAFPTTIANFHCVGVIWKKKMLSWINIGSSILNGCQRLRNLGTLTYSVTLMCIRSICSYWWTL